MVRLSRELRGDESVLPVKTAVKYILADSRVDGIYEKELQGMMFHASLNWNEDRPNKVDLFDCSYKKVRRAVYSPEIHAAFHSLGMRSRPSFEGPIRREKFATYSVREPVLPAGENAQYAVGIINAVIDEWASNQEPDTLMSWCVEQPEVTNLSSREFVEFE